MAKLVETLTIGDIKVHQLAEVAFSVKYKSSREIDEKKSDGADDATATDKGRKVRDVTISLSWPSIPAINAIMGPICEKLDASSGDGGKPFEFAHVRNGLDLGAIKRVRSVLIKDVDGPNNEPGNGIEAVEYSCDSWAKENKKTGPGKTPGEKDEKKTSDNPYGANFEPTPAGKIAEKPPQVKP